MKLIHNQMEYQITFNSKFVNTLVIESPAFFCSLVEQLSHQITGGEGRFVLSEDAVELSIEKNIELIVDPFINASHARRFMTTLMANLQTQAVSENFYQETAEMQNSLLAFASNLAHEYDGPITFAEEINLHALIKLLGFTFDFEDSFVENLVTYATTIHAYTKKSIFVFVNLKSFLEDEELQYLSETIQSKNCHLLLLESKAQNPFMKQEKCCIIDKDLCEIFSEGK